MDSSVQVLRLGIEGRWTCQEFTSLLSSVEDLYNLRLILEVLREDSREFDEIFFEMMHMPPFRRWRRKARLGFPLALSPLGLPASAALSTTQLPRLSEYLSPGEALEVRRISYASPGVSDLAGIGSIVGHVKDFAVRVIELWTERDQRRLQNEGRALDNEAKRIANAREFVSLASDLGYTDVEIRQFAAFADERQRILGNLVERQKLVTARIREPQEDSNE